MLPDWIQASDEVIRKAQNIKLMVFDVDGVLTDGRIFMPSSGDEIKIFHARDGQGFKLLAASGVDIAVISGRKSKVVAERMAALDVKHVQQGIARKEPVLRQLLDDLQLQAHQVAYMGDDIIDLAPLRIAGLAMAVADAHPLVKQAADWQSQHPGGYGAGREACDLILAAQGQLEATMAEHV